MVKNLILVFVGGGLGSMLRFLISKINYSNLNFPIGTLFVNILGSFFLFCLLFGLIEFIRGNILTGFPWNLIIYSFSDNLNFLSFLSIKINS